MIRESESDAQDFHLYWKHPDFGAAGWNGSSWKVDNVSMTSSPAIDPLSGFAFARLEGKPFVVTEWNGGQPSDFGAENLPMIAAWGAWQNWAAIYLFDYHSNGSYARDRIEGFFSIDSHPVKMATAISSALMFRRGDALPCPQPVTLSLPLSAAWEETASTGGQPTAAPFIKTWTQAGGGRDATLSSSARVRFEDGTTPSVSQRWKNAAGSFWARG